MALSAKFLSHTKRTLLLYGATPISCRWNWDDLDHYHSQIMCMYYNCIHHRHHHCCHHHRCHHELISISHLRLMMPARRVHNWQLAALSHLMLMLHRSQQNCRECYIIQYNMMPMLHRSQKEFAENVLQPAIRYSEGNVHRKIYKYFQFKEKIL